MLNHDASSDWKRYGEDDPYFGVLSDPRFHGKNLDGETRDEFFSSGRTHVEKLMQVLHEIYGDIQRGFALDFGCGVGRVTQALATHFDKVTGLDISPGMLSEARRNAQIGGITNVDYHSSVDPMQLRARSCDLVHSYIVLQHIPTKIGESIIAQLIECVNEGGVGAIHMTIMVPKSRWRTELRNLVKRQKILRIIANVALRRPWNMPAMEMNMYRMERIVEMLASSGIERFSCIRVDDWGSVGLWFLFQRGVRSQSAWSNPVRVA